MAKKETKATTKKSTKTTAKKSSKPVAKSAKSAKTTSKKPAKAKKNTAFTEVPVTARKVLANGKPSGKAKSFSSIKEAATWAVSEELTTNTANASVAISVTSLGRELHGKRGETKRNTAYGYSWTR